MLYSIDEKILNKSGYGIENEMSNKLFCFHLNIEFSLAWRENLLQQSFMLKC